MKTALSVCAALLVAALALPGDALARGGDGGGGGGGGSGPSVSVPPPVPLPIDQQIANALAGIPGATAVAPVPMGTGLLIGFAPAVAGFPAAPIIFEPISTTNGRPQFAP